MKSNWNKRRAQIFSNNLLWIEKSADDSWDAFIGKLRQLEDGEDPYVKKRRSNIEEAVGEMQREFKPGSFRDKRDEELFVNWKFGGLNIDPDRRTKYDVSAIDDAPQGFLY